MATAFSSRSASSGRFIVMRSIMATLRIEPSGLAMPLPAISGALPCTGSYSALRRPNLSTGPSEADGSMPSEPEAIAAQSDRMSPKMLPVTITSNCAGVAHDLHGGVVDIEMGQLDVGEFLPMQL